MKQNKQNNPFITTKIDKIITWARASSLWPMGFSSACCGVEIASAFSPHSNIESLGVGKLILSPRQSDLLIVSGAVNKKLAQYLKNTYEQMCEPKWVLCVGACACSGGLFKTYSVASGIDEIIPVDVYVPGCPPTPENIINSILQLQKKIKAKNNY